jgi:hypothetical protein
MSGIVIGTVAGLSPNKVAPVLASTVGKSRRLTDIINKIVHDDGFRLLIEIFSRSKIQFLWKNSSKWK